MAIKHKKINARKGNEALQRLRDEMKQTIDAIKGEEEFSSQTTPGGANTSELAQDFPSLRNVR